MHEPQEWIHRFCPVAIRLQPGNKHIFGGGGFGRPSPAPPPVVFLVFWYGLALKQGTRLRCVFPFRSVWKGQFRIGAAAA